ncbi:hypothetical protein A2U01_0010506 [Trifolium medium]|uniref:Uncharacterized protein n=1 Tax=Trifolium medium TaxID=97028 RepID=A0A392MQ00_9FABA|nr:hypothetical protein [Trifolium medium]
MLRDFCERVLANVRPNWVLKMFAPCPSFTDVRNYEEEMTLVMTISPSRDAESVEWDVKRQTFRLHLPRVRASEWVSL